MQLAKAIALYGCCHLDRFLSFQLEFEYMQNVYFATDRRKNMRINKNITGDRNWTTQKLVSLSKTLGRGYCPGFGEAEVKAESDFWTTDKFISMSRHLGSAYGVDFK